MSKEPSTTNNTAAAGDEEELSAAVRRPPSSMAKTPVAYELGKRIRKCREERGLSLESAAGKTVLHWTYIGQVERGQVNPTVLSVLRIADGMGVDAGDLLRGLHVPDGI